MTEMPQPKTETIRKLRAEIAILRKEHPELAALIDEREMLRKAVEMYERELSSLSGAIQKALRDPVAAGVAEPGLTIGRGTFNPVSPETSARLKKERAERETADAERLQKARAEVRKNRMR